MLGDPVSEVELSGVPIAMWRSTNGDEATVVTHDGLVVRLGLDPLTVRSTQPIPAFRDSDHFVAETVSKGSATLSHDGRWLVSTRWDAGEIVLSDLGSGAQTVYEVPFGRSRVGGVAFSHTGGSTDMLAVHARSSVEFYRLQDTELVHLGGQRIIPPSYPSTDDCFGGMSPDRLCGQLAQPLTWSRDGQYIVAGASNGSAEYAILEINPADGSSSKPRYLEVCPFGGDGAGWNGAAVAVSSNGVQYTPPDVPPTSTALPTASATRLPTQALTSTPTHTLAPTPLSATETPRTTVTNTASPTPVGSATLAPPTATPSRIYLPLALVEACPPRDLFTDVVLVIDASTSMRNLTADGHRKIDVAIEAAEVFVSGLRLDSARDRVAIVIFNESAETLQRLTDSRERAVAALSRIRTAEKSRVDRGVERATVELVARGRPGHVHAMVVLSDGKVNEVGRDQPGIAARSARRAGITVYVVGMGPSMDEQVLREMAGQADRFYPAPAPHLIRAIYSDLSERVPCPASAYWGRR
jgi:Mg-chelatase subunit ChlD